MVRRPVLLALVLCVATAIVAIVVTSDGRIERLRLVDGSRFSDMVTSSDVTVLVVDPAECGSCSAVMTQWIRQHRISPQRVKLVLTREPTERERTDLTLQHISEDAILESGLARWLALGVAVKIAPLGVVSREGELSATALTDVPWVW